jgi:hypothetical protein
MGAGTFHVSGGGHNVDPSLRRADRQAQSPGIARTEMAERVSHSWAADKDHTDQMTKNLTQNGVVHMHTVNTAQGARITKVDGGYVTDYPALKGNTFEDPRQAVLVSKQAIRADGGKLLKTGEHVDPLAARAEGGSWKDQAKERLTDPENADNAQKAFERFGETVTDKDPTGASGPMELLRDEGIDKIKDMVSPTGGTGQSFHQAIGGLVQSHAALMAPHMAAASAVVNHPAFQHAAHLVTQVVQARVDDAERNLQEALTVGDGRKITAARARLTRAQAQLLDAKLASTRARM